MGSSDGTPHEVAGSDDRLALVRRDILNFLESKLAVRIFEYLRFGRTSIATSPARLSVTTVAQIDDAHGILNRSPCTNCIRPEPAGLEPARHVEDARW